MRGPLLRKGGVRGAADQGLQLRFAARAEGHLLAGPVVNPEPARQLTLQFPLGFCILSVNIRSLLENSADYTSDFVSLALT